MPRLIITADDLGIHRSINESIREAYVNGVLTSGSMLITTNFVDSAVEEVVRATGMPVGLHLSLTTGRPCAQPERIPLLVDGQGCFKHSPVVLFKKFFGRRRDSELLFQIRLELEAQFEHAQKLGVDFSHFDSHQNIHLIHPVFEILKEVAPRYGFSKVRLGSEPFFGFTFFNRPLQILKEKNLLKWVIVRYCISKIQHTFTSPDHFYGIMYTGIMNKRVVLDLIKRLLPGRTYELVMHPGFPAKENADLYTLPSHNRFISSPNRLQEFHIATDPEVNSAIRAHGATLISYRELK